MPWWGSKPVGDKRSNPSVRDGIIAPEEDRYDYEIWCLVTRIEAERQMHTLASSYFYFRQIILVLLAAGGTLATSIVSFLEEDQSIAGVMAAISTFIQTIAVALNYQSRMDMHNAVVLDLDAQLTDLRLLWADRPTINFVKYIERFEQSLKGCKSIVPPRITAQYRDVTSDLYFWMHSDSNKLDGKSNSSGFQLLWIVYDQLQMSIARWRWMCRPFCFIPFFCFPIYIPLVIDEALNEVGGKLGLKSKDITMKQLVEKLAEGAAELPEPKENVLAQGQEAGQNIPAQDHDAEENILAQEHEPEQIVPAQEHGVGGENV